MSKFLKAIGASNIYKSGKTFIYEESGVFKPTATTFYLLHHLKQETLVNKDILDLGCGSGIIGFELFLFEPMIKKISMSDVSLEATIVAEKNSEELYGKNKISIKHGSLFMPWNKQKFDVIVNDVSGISTLIPFYHDWFEGIPLETGSQGLNLFSEVISNCDNYLNKNGKVISALISLSNVKQAYSIIKEAGLYFEILGRYFWSRKIKDSEELNKMMELKSEGTVDFEVKDEKFEFYTEILEIRRK